MKILLRAKELVVEGKVINEKIVEALVPLSKLSVCIMVVTLGAKGSVALVDGKKICVDAVSVPIVDTTGCGDAFQAGFVINYIKTKNIKYALAAGAKQAAKVAQHYGGVEQ